MKNNKLKVILLVAGEGKRLHPYTLDRPKCMVEVEGISLIDRQLSILKGEGLDNIIMIGGYKSEMLKGKVEKLKHNPKYYNTNMVRTLFCANEELEGEIIVAYGDIVYSKNILKALIKSTADISVTIDKNWESYWRQRNPNPLLDAETLKLDEDDNIIEIGQKPKSLGEIEGQYMGLIKFSNEGVKQLKEFYNLVLKNDKLLTKPLDNAYMTDLLQGIINAGKTIKSIPIYDDWVEVDTVEDLKSNETIRRLRSINKNS